MVYFNWAPWMVQHHSLKNCMLMTIIIIIIIIIIKQLAGNLEAKVDLAALRGPTPHLLWATHYMKVIDNVPFSSSMYSEAIPAWFEVGI